MSVKDKENVIQFDLHQLQKKAPSGAHLKPHKTPHRGSASVTDMTERRAEVIQQERRRVRRTILSEFIGVHAVVPNRGLMSITLHDISGDGLAFDVPPTVGQFRVGEEVAMRVYLNHKTYFPFTVKIQNVRMLVDEALLRHGAHFVKGSANIEAFHHFIRFIETVSAGLEMDGGDIIVSKLNHHR